MTIHFLSQVVVKLTFSIAGGGEADNVRHVVPYETSMTEVKPHQI